MICYWAKLVCSNSSNLHTNIYRIVNRNTFAWLNFVKSILDECGLSYIWREQTCISATWLKKKVKTILIDQFIQNWRETLFNSPKGLNYRVFKDTLDLETYLVILPTKHVILFVNLELEISNYP